VASTPHLGRSYRGHGGHKYGPPSVLWIGHKRGDARLARWAETIRAAKQARGGQARRDHSVAEAIARFVVELTIAFVPKRILPIVI
jgi:hypothetical protein